MDFIFKVSAIDSLRDSKEDFEKPNRSPFDQIVWVTKGSGIYRIDMEKYQVVDNTVFMIPSGRIRQFKVDASISGYVLSFNTEFLYLSTDGPGRLFCDEVVADFNNIVMFSLNSDPFLLHNVVAEMLRECENLMMLRFEVLSGLMKLFLIYMKRSSKAIRQQTESTRKLRLFNMFNSKLEKNFLTKRCVSDYADELAVTRSYLTEVVKKVTGNPASYHIQQRMVQEAKRLALYADSSMKATAYTLGFADPAHFSKFFKHATGMNFSEFKKTASTSQIN